METPIVRWPVSRTRSDHWRPSRPHGLASLASPVWTLWWPKNMVSVEKKVICGEVSFPWKCGGPKNTVQWYIRWFAFNRRILLILYLCPRTCLKNDRSRNRPTRGGSCRLYECLEVTCSESNCMHRMPEANIECSNHQCAIITPGICYGYDMDMI